MIECSENSILPEKNSLHPTEKESDRVQLQRAQYWDLVRGILAQNLIFIDESGLNLAMTRSHARAPKSKRAYAKVNTKRGKNVSLIGALGL